MKKMTAEQKKTLLPFIYLYRMRQSNPFLCQMELLLEYVAITDDTMAWNLIVCHVANIM